MGYGEEKSFQPLRTTQEQKILAELEQKPNQWVGVHDVQKHALAYNARIWSLRQQGYKIENRTELVAGQKHSFYRIVRSTEPQQLALMAGARSDSAAVGVGR